MKILRDFKTFALRGNIMDMAVGVVVGGAFSKIVTSLVNDLVMPLISLITGKITGRTDFANLFIALDGNQYPTIDEAKATGVATLNYGAFITTIIDFLIIAFSIFIVIRQINKFQEKISKIAKHAEAEAKTEEVSAPTTKECPFCKSDIHIEAAKCPNCTSDVSVAETKVTDATAKTINA